MRTRKQTTRLSVTALALTTLGSAWVGVSTPAAADPGRPAKTSVETTVVADGLETPKYLTFHGQSLYVAESGTGGPRCTHLVGVTGAATRACTGPTGKVDRIDRAGHVHTVLRGLASTREEDTGEVQGPIAVAFRHGRPLVLQRGAYVGPDGRSVIPGRLGREFGKLLAPRGGDGRLRTVSDLARFAARHPQPAATLGGVPGETTYDSDVHDVVSYRGGQAFADAGANDVLWRHRTGRLTLVARLPTTEATVPPGASGPGSPARTVQAQAVPSSVAVGPDGALYVATLSGFPGLPGMSKVYRVAPGKAPVTVVDGLTRASDIAFDGRGRLLVLEAKVGGRLAPPSSPGALLRATLVPGRVVRATPLPVPGLSAPTGLAVGPDGAVYVTNRTGTPGSGQVLRLSGLG